MIFLKDDEDKVVGKDHLIQIWCYKSARFRRRSTPVCYPVTGLLAHSHITYTLPTPPPPAAVQVVDLFCLTMRRNTGLHDDLYDM